MLAKERFIVSSHRRNINRENDDGEFGAIV